MFGLHCICDLPVGIVKFMRKYDHMHVCMRASCSSAFAQGRTIYKCFIACKASSHLPFSRSSCLAPHPNDLSVSMSELMFCADEAE